MATAIRPTTVSSRSCPVLGQLGGDHFQYGSDGEAELQSSD